VRSVEEMAARTLELLSGDHARMQSISEAARNAWEIRFTPERFQARLLEAVEAAARKRPAAPDISATAPANTAA
jgi:hypothetical protein